MKGYTVEQIKAIYYGSKDKDEACLRLDCSFEDICEFIRLFDVPEPGSGRKRHVLPYSLEEAQSLYNSFGGTRAFAKHLGIDRIALIRELNRIGVVRRGPGQSKVGK